MTDEEREAIERRNALVEQNLGLVRKMVGQLTRAMLWRIGGRDEADSVGLRGLLKAAQGFDPARGTKFSTYACVTISRCLYRAAGEYRAREPLPVDDHLWARPDERLDQIDLQDQIERVKRAMRRLSAPQRKVLRLTCLQGLTVTEAARKLGVSKQAVQQLRDVALAGLRERLGVSKGEGSNGD